MTCVSQPNTLGLSLTNFQYTIRYIVSFTSTTMAYFSFWHLHMRLPPRIFYVIDSLQEQSIVWNYCVRDKTINGRKKADSAQRSNLWYLTPIVVPLSYAVINHFRTGQAAFLHELGALHNDLYYDLVPASCRQAYGCQQMIGSERTDD